MGGKESVPTEVKGHPELFYLGVEEVKLGRYLDAEIYFHQALRQHEGRPFWVKILNGYWGRSTKADKRKRADETTSAAQAIDVEKAEHTETANEEGKSEVLEKVSTQDSNSADILYVDIPLDTDIIPILDYLRLMADIMNTYLCRNMDDKNASLALVHCCYLGIHIQLLFTLIKLWDAENAELLQKIQEGTLFEVDETLKEEDRSETNQKNNHKDKKKNKKEAAAGSGMKQKRKDHISNENKHTPKNGQSEASEDTAHKQTSDEDEVTQESKNPNKKRQVWKIVSKHEIPTFADILIVRLTIVGFARHYWLAALFNYCSIALLYVEKRCSPNETKKINHILHNILEASSSSISDLRNILETEGDKNSFALNLLKRMPKTVDNKSDVDGPKKDAGSVGTGSTGHASGGHYSETSRVSSQFFYSLTNGTAGASTGGNSAMQTFLSISANFSPTYPFMLDATMTLPVRLNLRIDTPKSKLCTTKMEPPGNCNLFYYTNWFSLQDVFMVAGYNSHFLNKMLPYYTTPAAGEESSFMSKVRMNGSQVKAGVGATFIKRDKDFNVEQMTSTETVNYVDPALRQLMKNDLVKNQHIVQRIKTQKTFFNPLLKQNDVYTISTVLFEEDILHTFYPILMQSKVLNKMGKEEEAEAWITFLLRTAGELYGKESQEYTYLNRVLETYK